MKSLAEQIEELQWGGPAWLTNGRVAWGLGGRIGEMYRLRLYRPPEGWRVRIGKLPKCWKRGKCREMRREARRTRRKHLTRVIRTPHRA